MRLRFITQFKIEFLLPLSGCRKVLGKMPAGPIQSRKCMSLKFTRELCVMAIEK